MTDPPSPLPPNRPLPRLLCLHGGGTSSLIFKIQLRHLAWALRPYFSLLFVTAPFPSPPGPGVLPVFEACGPFYRWQVPEAEDQLGGALRVRQVLQDAIAEDEEAGGTGEVVGVLGFSQGARMAAGLLADREAGEGGWVAGLKVGVLVCGSYPPYSLAAARKIGSGWKPERADEHGEVREVEKGEAISCPSVHVRGLMDVHLEKGRRLAKWFDDKVEMEYEMGHHLPGAAGDTTSPKEATKEIAEAILRQVGMGQVMNEEKEEASGTETNGSQIRI